MTDYRLLRFEDGFTPLEEMVIEEHGWSIASKSLQSEVEKSKHELHIADLHEPSLTDDELYSMYELLLPIDGEVEALTSDMDKVLIMKYLYA